MPPSRPRKRPRRASPWQGTLRLGLVFTALIGVNFYFFFLRGGTSLRALLRTSELKRQGLAGAEDVAPPPPPPARPQPREPDDDARVVEGVMREGDTVERVWRASLPPARSAELARAL